MSDKQVRDEAVTLFLAGHDTTANTLNWTWYLLAQNPKVEAKLHHEIDTVLEGQRAEAAGWQGGLYQPRSVQQLKRTSAALKAIPYCFWANRQPGEMRVWIRES